MHKEMVPKALQKLLAAPDTAADGDEHVQTEDAFRDRMRVLGIAARQQKQKASERVLAEMRRPTARHRATPKEKLLADKEGYMQGIFLLLSELCRVSLQWRQLPLYHGSTAGIWLS